MNSDPISWTRLRAIFGNPKPVLDVTERQFDYCDEELQQLGRTPFDQIDFDDLWYYQHDLAYVDLQPELFAHLFPVCLMDWHRTLLARTLLANDSCNHGDSEFHYGIIRGGVLEKMLTREQRSEVNDVFHNSMLYRLDQERGFKCDDGRTASGWMPRLNSLGLFFEMLPRFWKAWWAIEKTGYAVCLLQYCSGLMYFDGENPLFREWSGKGGPHLWGDDSFVFDRGWSEDNVHFLREFLTTERIVNSVRMAAERLEAEPEAERAAHVANDLDDHNRLDLIDSRVAELPDLLASNDMEDWSV